MAWITLSATNSQQLQKIESIATSLNTRIYVYNKNIRIRIPIDLEEREITLSFFEDEGIDFKLSGVIKND